MQRSYGCSHFQLLLRVHLPILRPALAVVAIFTFVFAWNELILALMLTEVDAKTAPVAIVGMVQQDDIPWVRSPPARSLCCCR
jgi:multiple sugar transport system permease protein